MPQNTKTRKLDYKYVEHLAKILRPIRDNDVFRGNATLLARAIGISQSQLSQVFKARKGNGDRSIGIAALLAIRFYLRNITLDDMLGLPPPPDLQNVSSSAIEDAVRRVIGPEAAALREAVKQAHAALPPSQRSGASDRSSPTLPKKPKAKAKPKPKPLD